MGPRADTLGRGGGTGASTLLSQEVHTVTPSSLLFLFNSSADASVLFYLTQLQEQKVFTVKTQGSAHLQMKTPPTHTETALTRNFGNSAEVSYRLYGWGRTQVAVDKPCGDGALGGKKTP